MGCLLGTAYAQNCSLKDLIGGTDGRAWVLNLKDANGVELQYTKTGNTISGVTVQSGSQAWFIDGQRLQTMYTT